MKIGIIGDLHFGSSYALGRTDPKTQLNSRLIDFTNTYNSIVDAFKEHGVETVVITGDCTDTRNPSPSVIGALSECIKRTLDKSMEVVIIAGNHDQLRTSQTTTIDFLSKLDIPGLSVFVDFGVKSFKDCHLVLLPYRDRKQFNATSNQDATIALKNIVKKLTNELVGTKIGIAHFMVGSAPAGIDSETFSMSEIIVPPDTFDGLDFVVAGHIHSAELLQKQEPTILYVGSMEKITFGDRNTEKRSILIDTKNLNKFQSLPTKTRQLIEVTLDYQSTKPMNQDINDKIINDLSDFTMKHDMHQSIARVVLNLHDSDMYYLNQDRIKDKLISCGVNCVAGIQAVSSSSRQPRNNGITEKDSPKKAFRAYIESLKELDTTKEDLIRMADQIIDSQTT